MAFDPNKHLRTVGKEKDGTPRVYLDVKWRIVWFRETYPLGAIDTELFSLGDLVYVRARVIVDTQIASGMATVRSAGANEQAWAGREIEKAETAAIGRALALAGFGTQFSGDGDGDDLADVPIEQADGYNPATDKPAQPKGTARQNATDRWTAITKEAIKYPHYQRDGKPNPPHVSKTYNLLKEHGFVNDDLGVAVVVQILREYGDSRDSGQTEQEALDSLSVPF